MKSDPIGFTTTIPVEILLAAKLRPLDLNNAFINSSDVSGLVEDAEKKGFPQNICAWHKGIFSVVKRLKIKHIIAVVQGDCSSSQALAELLAFQGITMTPFAYPYNQNRKLLVMELNSLARRFRTTLKSAEQVKLKLDRVRDKVRRVDELTWRFNKVHGRENHYWLVSCSDFNSDFKEFDRKIDSFLVEVEARTPFDFPIRLGYVGVPPICPQLYDFLEQNDAIVVFNETQRQFSMPYRTKSLVNQYLKYTYPYSIFNRIEDIKNEIARRRVHGIIHYVQNFCHRHIHDNILRQSLQIPILTLEFDKPANIDGRTANRIQAFLEMLRG